ncbi:MAG: carbohydrate kinase, partial [Candidatus Marinimicrobia bacterium]|nr:carbohydrate kinase [Candidatus Neomarinimicrobiota bacterium]
ENPDERILTCPETAGAYTPEQFEELEAKAFLINGSIRPEVPVNVVKSLSKKDGLLVADAQTFIRVIGPGSRLVNAEWPEKKIVLSMLDILKADVVEAESLTGEKDLRKAAKIIVSWGPKEAVLTHRDGILVYDGKSFYEAGFFPKQLIGRSGRGDTCIASYAAARLSKPPSEAIIWSAAVTSLKMESDGPFMRPMADVEALIRTKYLITSQ